MLTLTFYQTIYILSGIAIFLILFIIAAIAYVLWLDKQEEYMYNPKPPRLPMKTDAMLTVSTNDNEFWGTLEDAQIFS